MKSILIYQIITILILLIGAFREAKHGRLKKAMTLFFLEAVLAISFLIANFS